jgi:hypothetical protein
MTRIAGLYIPTMGTAPETLPVCEGLEELDAPVGLDELAVDLEEPEAPPVTVAEVETAEPEAEDATAKSCSEEKV